MGTDPNARATGWHQSALREFVNYTVGGILAWGLIGWGLDYLLQTRWIWIAGAVLGAGAGFYLAHLHRKARASGSDPGEHRDSP
ncbi:hypothetical protein ACX8Z9_00445 [Arthrobacter halodurans]|uniref:F0F1-ATPase subunit Ca2+/Mg2+ transporter n=1 Tax=Arthrobacter halodurans TaxID=516699 RepID=A0ABV4ULT7_9MICC